MLQDFICRRKIAVLYDIEMINLTKHFQNVLCRADLVLLHLISSDYHCQILQLLLIFWVESGTFIGLVFIYLVTNEYEHLFLDNYPGFSFCWLLIYISCIFLQFSFVVDFRMSQYSGFPPHTIIFQCYKYLFLMSFATVFHQPNFDIKLITLTVKKNPPDLDST